MVRVTYSISNGTVSVRIRLWIGLLLLVAQCGGKECCNSFY